MTISVNAQQTMNNTDNKVVNIRMARKAQEQAQQELLDYMMWTMKHDMDPHRLYDDPIAVFRSEVESKLKSGLNVA